MAEIDTEMLSRERRGFFIATQGGVYFPVAGSIFWLGLGGAGFYLSARTWCVLVLSAGVVAIPIGILLFKKLLAHLTLKSPLASLILPALLPIALSVGMALAVVLWFLLPDGRFTWLPISIGLVYAATAAWIFRDLQRLRTVSIASPGDGH